MSAGSANGGMIFVEYSMYMRSSNVRLAEWSYQFGEERIDIRRNERERDGNHAHAADFLLIRGKSLFLTRRKKKRFKV